MASLGELFIQLAFEGDTKGAQEFQKKVSKVVQTLQKNAKQALENNKALEVLSAVTDKNTGAEEKNLQARGKNDKTMKSALASFKNYILAVSGAIYAIHRLTNSLLKENQQWLNLTRTSDIALQTFQKWDSVGKTLGVTNAADQIKNLNDRLFELKLTGQGARGFMLAGINPTNAEDVLEQLRNRVSGLNDTSASYILEQMGLDPNMLHILRMSKREFEEINAELRKYRLTPQQRRDLQAFNVQIQIAAQKLQYLKQKAIIALMPAWTKFFQSLARVTEGVSWFIKRVKEAISLCSPLEKRILAIAAAIGVVIAAITLLNCNPIVLALSAIIGAIYLLVDDIVGYFQGKESVTGDILYFLDEIKEKINFATPQWIKDLIALLQKGSKLKEFFDKKNKDNEEGKKNAEEFSQKYPFLTPMDSLSPVPPSLTRQLLSNIGNPNNTSSNTIYFTQHNAITTTESAQEANFGFERAQQAFV